MSAVREVRVALSRLGGPSPSFRRLLLSVGLDLSAELLALPSAAAGKIGAVGERVALRAGADSLVAGPAIDGLTPLERRFSEAGFRSTPQRR
jgi:hypothetical protein